MFDEAVPRLDRWLDVILAETVYIFGPIPLTPAVLGHTWLAVGMQDVLRWSLRTRGFLSRGDVIRLDSYQYR